MNKTKKSYTLLLSIIEFPKGKIVNPKSTLLRFKTLNDALDYLYTVESLPEAKSNKFEISYKIQKDYV